MGQERTIAEHRFEQPAAPRVLGQSSGEVGERPILDARDALGPVLEAEVHAFRPARRWQAFEGVEKGEVRHVIAAGFSRQTARRGAGGQGRPAGGAPAPRSRAG